MIVTGGGRWISMTAINMHSNIFDEIRQFQFHQREPGRLTFRFIPRPTWDEAASRKVRSGLTAKLVSQAFSFTPLLLTIMSINRGT